MSCIYDFQMTKDKMAITFVMAPHDLSVRSTSPDVQNYENAWLVHTRPLQQVLTADVDGTSYSRTVLKLYSPSRETDYYMSGDDYLSPSRLSDESVIDGGREISAYQYIGSYLKGNSNIYHVYAYKRIYRDEDRCLTREALGPIKVFPVLNGVFSPNNQIYGNLVQNPIDQTRLSVVGADVCFSFNETNGVLTFAAQTVFKPGLSSETDASSVELSANADGPAINDPLNPDMNSHDVFNTNVTLFYKQVLAKKLIDVRSGDRELTFNTNADMSYFPVYPGVDGRAELWRKPEYSYYNVELLGTARDINDQIQSVNPNPNPYLDYDSIMSGFANARVYEDYAGFVDSSLKIVDNRLIGLNSDVLNQSFAEQYVTVSDRKDEFYWTVRLDRLYGGDVAVDKMGKIKALAFNKKCNGKNPYLFADLSSFEGEFKDLQYDMPGDADESNEYSLLSAPDYDFSFSNRVITTSTHDGERTVGVNDSNHIRNVGRMQAKFERFTDEDSGEPAARVVFRLAIEDPS